MTQPRLRSPQPAAWARVYPDAMTSNLAWLRHRLRASSARAPGAVAPPRLWAVVKSDAYGHGLHHAVKSFGQADGLAVATADDLYRLRSLGWKGPLLLLSGTGIDPEALRDPHLAPLHLVIDEPAALERLERIARAAPAALHVWLRWTGELRNMGFDEEAYPAAFARLQALAGKGVIAAAGHLLHYACAEDPEALARERNAFDALTAGLPGPRCTGNSATLCGSPECAGQLNDAWLRCGLALYGASAVPGKDGATLGLRPAMALQARLSSLHRVRAGQTVGYGAEFRARCDTWIGIVGIGYGHGLPRHLWRRGHVLVGPANRPVRFAGRIAMDSLTIDLGPQPAEQPGDVVTFWGPTGSGAILPVEAVAAACDTIAAELLTGLTARIPLVSAA